MSDNPSKDIPPDNEPHEPVDEPYEPYEPPPVHIKDVEMSAEFWRELSKKTGLVFPLCPLTSSRGRASKLLGKTVKPDPEEHLTRERTGNTKIRQPKQQPQTSAVNLREDKVQEDPFARDACSGGVGKLREEVPVVYEPSPSGSAKSPYCARK